MIVVHPLVVRASIEAPGGVLVLVAGCGIYGLSSEAPQARVALKSLSPGQRATAERRRRGTMPFASGGPVTSTRPYIIGERGPELVRVVDVDEQLRFDAECARDATADQGDDW